MSIFLVVYSFLLTIIIETLFLALLFSKLAKYQKTIFAFTNAITNLFAQTINYLLITELNLNYYLSLFLVEVVVFISEFFFYLFYFKNMKISLFSIIGNLFTLSLSFIINALVNDIILVVIVPISICVVFILLTYLIKRYYGNYKAKRKSEIK